MKLLDLVKDFLLKKEVPKQTPDGYCPNCWGRQEYGGEFYEAIYKEDINLNNVEEKKGWIQAYALENLEGIKLDTSANPMTCPSCKVSYQKEVE